MTVLFGTSWLLIHCWDACPGPNHLLGGSRTPMSVNPLDTVCRTLASMSFSRRLYVRIVSSSTATDRFSLPALTISYSSGVTTAVPSAQFFGSITVRNDDWKNGPVSQMYIHGFLPLHWQVASRHPHVFGLIRSRLFPRMSNCHFPHWTGCGGFPGMTCLRNALPSLVSNSRARLSGSDRNICVKS